MSEAKKNISKILEAKDQLQSEMKKQRAASQFEEFERQISEARTEAEQMREQYELAESDSQQLNFEVTTLRNYVVELKSMISMMMDPSQPNVRKGDINLDEYNVGGEAASSSPHGKFSGKVAVTRSVVSPHSPSRQSTNSRRRAPPQK